MREVTCKECGWVHMGVSSDRMNKDFYKCFNCGGSYKNFRPAVDTDAPAGVTIKPIKDFED